VGTIQRKSITLFRKKLIASKSDPNIKLKDIMIKFHVMPKAFPRKSQSNLDHNGPLRGKAKRIKIVLKSIKEARNPSFRTYFNAKSRIMAKATPIVKCAYWGFSL
jgi:hypothetical protein